MNTNDIPQAHPELLDALHRQDEQARKMKLSEGFTEKVMKRIQQGQQTHPLPLPMRKESGYHSVWRKVAAVFVAAAILCGLAWAVIPHLVSFRTKSTPSTSVTTPLPTSEEQGGVSVCFDNTRLDSLLTVVSTHYKRKLFLDNDTTGGMRLTTVWTPARPLAEFIETLNEFDNLRLTDRNDTLFVVSVTKEDGK